MKFIAIIPARYGSSRFPGKPLIDIDGSSMIVRVCRRVSEAIDNVVVATDDARIASEVENYGFKAVMTSTYCPNGTARVLEAYRKLGVTADVIINVQGDEPMIEPDVIGSLTGIFRDEPSTEIATMACQFNASEGFDALFDPNRVKMTMDSAGHVLYFSRSIIPYIRDYEWQEWVNRAEFFIHCGIYAFRTDILPELVALPKSSLEKAENLEQLRWLQNGYKISAAVTDHKPLPVDCPEDVEQIIASLKGVQ